MNTQTFKVNAGEKGTIGTGHRGMPVEGPATVIVLKEETAVGTEAGVNIRVEGMAVVDPRMHKAVSQPIKLSYGKEMGRLETIKAITENVKFEAVHRILEIVNEHQLTILNLEEINEIVQRHMRANATLEKEPNIVNNQ